MKAGFDHIVDLLGKYLAHEATTSERTQVDEWRAASEENEQYFQHLHLIFERARTVGQTQSFDTDRAWLQVKSKMSSAKGRTIALRPNWSVLRIAAILLISIGGGYFVYQWLNAPAPVTVIAATQKIVRDSLPDGSFAVLNRHSTIRYTYNKRNDQRKVHLEGEAYFDVKHFEEKPFIIETGEVIIEDIGTSFNVLAFPESPTVEVYVESGEVAFYTLKDAGLNLVAGETGVYHRNTKSFARIMKTDTNKLAYKTGVFSFRNADLETIVNDLNSVYDAKVKLANEAIKGCRLNVAFRNERLQDIVEIIAETLSLSVTKEGEDFVLNGNGCGN